MRYRFVSLLATVAALLILSSVATAGTMYTTHSSGSRLATIDTTTGAGAVIGPFGFGGVWGLSFSPDGTLYVATGGQLATVNLATGAATRFGASNAMNILQFSSSGTLYGASLFGGNIFQLDPVTGDATLIGTPGALGFTAIMDLAMDSHGTMYAIADPPNPPNPSRLYTIDLATGIGTLVNTFTEPCMMALAFDPADNLYATGFCVSNSPLYLLEPGTPWTATLVGFTGLNSHGGDFSPVPEPATCFTVGACLLVISLRRLARQRR
jgi:hypothetical protein